MRETSIPNEQERYDNECERMLCVLLYRILEARIGVSPRWGILTGVRPVNIIQRERLTGKSDAEIAAWLSEKYLVSAEKLKLAFLTADTHEPRLRSMKPRSFSLYIAIPFCVAGATIARLSPTPSPQKKRPIRWTIMFFFCAESLKRPRRSQKTRD